MPKPTTTIHDTRRIVIVIMAANNDLATGPKSKIHAPVENSASTTHRYYRDSSHTTTVPVVNDGSHFFRALVWDMYKTGRYSDFTIKVQGSVREFHVHRAVICPQSSIFEAACRGEFVVSFFKCSFRA
jgi:hypothetical protein